MSDQASSPAPAPAPTPQQKPETMGTQVKEEPDSPSLTANTNSVAPSSPPGKWRTAAERHASLRDDPLVGEVEPHRVYCLRCGRWIKLALKTPYTPSNWNLHAQRCHGRPTSSPRRTPSKPNFSPDSRVATTERQIVLLNDLQVKSFSVRRVNCRVCKMAVELDGGVDYNLTKWTEHKEKCKPMTPTLIGSQESRPRMFPPLSTSSAHSMVSAGGSARSSTPVERGSGSQSTETTAVAQSSPPDVKIGVKRGREEESGDEGARDAVRLRTETYKVPEGSLFEWLARPFREFARGFREGLR